MSDLKWGFEKTYAHKVTPAKWQSNAEYTFYMQSPLAKKSFRAPGSQPMTPRATGALHDPNSGARGAATYVERPQDKNNCMSTYGVHREMPWDCSLRSPLVRRMASKPASQGPRSNSAPGTSRADAAKRQNALATAASATLRPGSAGVGLAK